MRAYIFLEENYVFAEYMVSCLPSQIIKLPHLRHLRKARKTKFFCKFADLRNLFMDRPPLGKYLKRLFFRQDTVGKKLNTNVSAELLYEPLAFCATCSKDWDPSR